MVIKEALRKEVQPSEPKQYAMTLLKGLYGPKDEQGKPTEAYRMALIVNAEGNQAVFLPETYANPQDIDSSALTVENIQILPQIQEINPKTVVIAPPDRPLPTMTIPQILRGVRNNLRHGDYKDFPSSFKIPMYLTIRERLYNSAPQAPKSQQ